MQANLRLKNTTFHGFSYLIINMDTNAKNNNLNHSILEAFRRQLHRFSNSCEGA